MRRRPPRSTRNDTLFPTTTLVRSIEAFRLRGGADRELTIPELFVVGRDQNEPLATRLETRANFHFRIVEVASMFLIPLLAIALARPEEHTSELQSLMRISYAVFCLKKKMHPLHITRPATLPP